MPMQSPGRAHLARWVPGAARRPHPAGTSVFDCKMGMTEEAKQGCRVVPGQAEPLALQTCWTLCPGGRTSVPPGQAPETTAASSQDGRPCTLWWWGRLPAGTGRTEQPAAGHRWVVTSGQASSLGAPGSDSAPKCGSETQRRPPPEGAPDLSTARPGPELPPSHGPRGWSQK